MKTQRFFSNLSIVWCSWGVSGQLGTTWRCLWDVQGHLGGVVGRLRGVLEVLGTSRDVWRAPWTHLGRVVKKISKKDQGCSPFLKCFVSQKWRQKLWKLAVEKLVAFGGFFLSYVLNLFLFLKVAGGDMFQVNPWQTLAVCTKIKVCQRPAC